MLFTSGGANPPLQTQCSHEGLRTKSWADVLEIKKPGWLGGGECRVRSCSLYSGTVLRLKEKGQCTRYHFGSRTGAMRLVTKRVNTGFLVCVGWSRVEVRASVGVDCSVAPRRL